MKGASLILGPPGVGCSLCREVLWDAVNDTDDPTIEELTERLRLHECRV